MCNDCTQVDESGLANRQMYYIAYVDTSVGEDIFRKDSTTELIFVSAECFIRG